MKSKYKYLGCLKSLPVLPDPEALEALDRIVVNGQDLAAWAVADDPAEKEWRDVSVRLERLGDVLSLRGHFEDIRRIDNLSRNHPHYWAPLSLKSEDNSLFPLNCMRYPVVEITYRVTTSHAQPACLWSYPGGGHETFLEACREWHTVALLMPLRRFPQTISGFTMRLYSAMRSTEAMEVASICFRALLPEEESILADLESQLHALPPPRRYPVLDEFLPFGVSMHVGTAERLAELLDISFFDYWRLAFEDIARHYHNCVLVQDIQRLSQDDRHVLLDLAENFGLKVIPSLDWDMDHFIRDSDAILERDIRPFAESNAILAWNIHAKTSEDAICAFVQARDGIARTDPWHPAALNMHQGDSLSLFAPLFPISGFSYLKSDAHAELAQAVRAHLPFAGGQQFWVTAPTFQYASDAPDWNSSPQLRLMLNLSLANGARGWLAHTYHNAPIWADGHYQRSLTGPFLTFSDLWAELGNRVERLSVLAPLFLYAAPAAPPENIHLHIVGKKHVKSLLPNNAELLSTHWLKGPDYYLFYIVNNDTDQVTSVNVEIPPTLPDGLDIYDTTVLARMRAWIPSEHQRHIEMFPGQGQLFLLAEPPVCEKWRETIARRIWLADQQQAKVDLELAHQYRLDVSDISGTLNAQEAQSSIDGLLHIHSAREKLFNRIYSTPEIFETRQLLIKASSILCGCDEALAAHYGRGRAELTHEIGVKIMPLAKNLTELRLKLRRGSGKDIYDAAIALVQQAEDMLREIWRIR